MKVVAEETSSSLVDIYGVATFYKSFSLQPRGRHLISVCPGTACHVSGATMIVEEFERQLEIIAGTTTNDREFTLDTVACLGACAPGPIVVVDGHYSSNVKPTKVSKILAKTRAGLDDIEMETDERVFPVGVSCSRCNHSLMDAKHLVEGQPSIRVTAAFNGKHGWLRLIKSPSSASNRNTKTASSAGSVCVCARSRWSHGRSVSGAAVKTGVSEHPLMRDPISAGSAADACTSAPRANCVALTPNPTRRSAAAAPI